MYPFYYPFAPPFCPEHYPFYNYDLDFNNVNQNFEMTQQFNLQEKQEKIEEVNTGYSVNGQAPKAKSNSNPSTNTVVQKDFLHSKEIGFKSQIVKQRKDEDQYKLKAKTCALDLNQRLRYVSKNFQSNIINKFFSFLWSEDKSRIFVDRIWKDKTKTKLYFEYIKIVRKYCKRYINKEYLQNLCNYQSHHIAYRIVARHIDKHIYFTIEDLSESIRKLIFIYLKNVCSLSILTSKKLSTDKWKDHFEKSRNIYQFLFEGLSSEEYNQRMSQTYQSIYGSPRDKQKRMNF